MATFLKALAGFIPWADVVKSAPTILAAAKDLIEGTPKPRPPDLSQSPASDSAPPGEEILVLQEKIEQFRVNIVELQTDSRHQAEIIERLAEQADQLVIGSHTFRRRLSIIFGIALLSLILAVGCFIILLRMNV